jgi:hypothetical protein
MQRGTRAAEDGQAILTEVKSGLTEGDAKDGQFRDEDCRFYGGYESRTRSLEPEP